MYHLIYQDIKCTNNDVRLEIEEAWPCLSEKASRSSSTLETNMHRARAYRLKEEKTYGLETSIYLQYKIYKNVEQRKKRHAVT
jgi:hypothetical protein